MSMHDPGWDDAGFDSGGSNAGWSGGDAPGPVGPSHGGVGGGPPRWQQPRVLAVVGGLVLVVIIVLAVLVIKNRSSDEQAASHPPTTPPSSPSSSVRSTPKTSPTPSKSTAAFVSLDDWDAKADAVCTSYKARLLKANQNVAAHNDWKDFVALLAAQIRAFERIPAPTKQADVVQKWLEDLHGTLSDAAAHNPTAFDASVLPADTYAGKMGMHVCNYGH